MEFLRLDETLSTNSYCRQHTAELAAPVCVSTGTQTAGRGQRGNSWEAQPGMNLTFSIVWRPEGVAPRDQFAISEAVALGVVSYLKRRGIEAMVKWPNDIYVADRKICGILIEHSIVGSEIERSVIGVGVNVNQTVFVSDAPNPVSMSQLSGKRYDLESELEELVGEISRGLENLSFAEVRMSTHKKFLSQLWRGDGRAYPFRDVAGENVYNGIISDVEPEGYLIVKNDESGIVRRYAFKEVEFIL